MPITLAVEQYTKFMNDQIRTEPILVTHYRQSWNNSIRLSSNKTPVLIKNNFKFDKEHVDFNKKKKKNERLYFGNCQN